MTIKPCARLLLQRPFVKEVTNHKSWWKRLFSGRSVSNTAYQVHQTYQLCVPKSVQRFWWFSMAYETVYTERWTAHYKTREEADAFVESLVTMEVCERCSNPESGCQVLAWKNRSRVD